jgi:hypothetical protein
MPTSNPLPTHFPDGTKYVIEGRGARVHRHIEYPDGSRVELPPRKALSCNCPEARNIVAKSAPKVATPAARKSTRKAA